MEMLPPVLPGLEAYSLGQSSNKSAFYTTVRRSECFVQDRVGAQHTAYLSTACITVAVKLSVVLLC